MRFLRALTVIIAVLTALIAGSMLGIEIATRFSDGAVPSLVFLAVFLFQLLLIYGPRAWKNRRYGGVITVAAFILSLAQVAVVYFGIGTLRLSGC